MPPTVVVARGGSPLRCGCGAVARLSPSALGRFAAGPLAPRLAAPQDTCGAVARLSPSAPGRLAAGPLAPRPAPPPDTGPAVARLPPGPAWAASRGLASA